MGCAVAAFFAGLPFVYVGSFIVFTLAYPVLDPRMTRPLHDFYSPLIWLCLQGETVQQWIAQA